MYGGSQRTTCGNSCPPPTVWGLLGIEFRLSGWPQVPLPAEPFSQLGLDQLLSVERYCERPGCISSIFSYWWVGVSRFLLSFRVMEWGSVLEILQTGGAELGRDPTLLSLPPAPAPSTAFQSRACKGGAVIPWCSRTAVTMQQDFMNIYWIYVF